MIYITTEFRTGIPYISLHVIFYLEELVEYRVFIKFYSRLTTVFRNKDYLPHLVTAGIVAPDSVHYLSSLSNRDRAMHLLEYISDSLEGGEKECFCRMLEIMHNQGNLHAQNVAEEINKAIVSGADSIARTFTARTFTLGSIARAKSDSIGSVASNRSDISARSDNMGSFNTSISEGT